MSRRLVTIYLPGDLGEIARLGAAIAEIWPDAVMDVEEDGTTMHILDQPLTASQEK